MSQCDDNLSIQAQHALLKPERLFRELPLTQSIADTVLHARHVASQIMQAKDNRLLVIVGPCSIHDPQAALEYAGLLADAAARFADELFIIMRVYFEKPRTTVGWKGLISDPFLNGSFDMNSGLRLARKLLLDLNASGIPAATEFLDTMIPRYISDLIAWCAIGARTSASQLHRELASGLPLPVGFKNSTDGNVKIAIDAVNVASFPHHCLGINIEGVPMILHTSGNQRCHVILRGSYQGPNYDAHHVRQVSDALQAEQLIPRLMIDCSHGNSMKDYQRQCQVAHSIAEQLAAGSQAIGGVMIESHLVSGNQMLKANHSLVYGQSITDACISWEETFPLLEKLASAVRRRATLSK